MKIVIEEMEKSLNFDIWNFRRSNIWNVKNSENLKLKRSIRYCVREMEYCKAFSQHLIERIVRV